MKNFIMICLLMATGLPVCAGNQLLTVPEKTDYRSTSRLSDVNRFFSALQDRYPEQVIRTTMGQTAGGYDIPLVILGNPAVPEPASANRPCILLVANIHGGEVEGKEVLQMIARDLLESPDSTILRTFTILMVPVFNVDGNEQISPDHRSYQKVKDGVGLRTNGLNMDLNRDFVKLEAPETRALVQLFDRWQPFVYVDCHTTNGSYHIEPLTWTWGANPNGNRSMHTYIYKSLFPGVNELAMKNHHIMAIPYGNFDDPFNPTRWETFSSRLVYGVSYFGVKGAYAFLNENYAHADFPTRIKACYAFIDSLLQYARDHEKDMLAIMQQFRKQDGVEYWDQIEPRLFPDPVTIRGFRMEKSDTGRAVPTDERVDYKVSYVGDATGTVRHISGAYVFPPVLTNLADRLRMHGIHVYRTTESVSVPAVAYDIDSLTFSDRPFQGHVMVTDVKGSFQDITCELKPGWFVVPLNRTQPYRQLAAILLEPESEDALLRYGLLNTLIYPSQWRDRTGRYPVYRTPTVPAAGMELIP